MYSNYLVSFFALLLFTAFVYWCNYKEPFDGSPYDYTQEQAGEIQQLYDKTQTITLTEALIDSLQSDNDQTTDQINQLQANMPTKTEAEAYP
jgi:Tfp pilus assembly protein PilO